MWTVYDDMGAGALLFVALFLVFWGAVIGGVAWGAVALVREGAPRLRAARPPAPPPISRAEREVSS